MRTLQDSLQKTLELLIDINSARKPDGILTGWPELDELLRGMHRGTLTAAAFAPDFPGTRFALNLVKNLAVSAEMVSIVFSSDQDDTGLTLQLLSLVSGVKCNEIPGNSSGKIAQLADAAAKLKTAPLWFTGHCGDDKTFFRRLRSFHDRKQFDLLIAENVSPGNCPHLKNIAAKLNIAVLALLPGCSGTDKILSRAAADTFITLRRKKAARQVQANGLSVGFTISKSIHGLCGGGQIHCI